MQVAKIQSRGRVTLPSDVRKALGVQPGDHVEFHKAKPGRIEVKVSDRARPLERQSAVNRLSVAVPKTKRQMELPI